MCCIILCAVVFLMLTLFCAIVFKKQIASNNANMDPYTIDIRDIRMSASMSIYVPVVMSACTWAATEERF